MGLQTNWCHFRVPWTLGAHFLPPPVPTACDLWGFHASQSLTLHSWASQLISVAGFVMSSKGRILLDLTEGNGIHLILTWTNKNRTGAPLLKKAIDRESEPAHTLVIPWIHIHTCVYTWYYIIYIQHIRYTWMYTFVFMQYACMIVCRYVYACIYACVCLHCVYVYMYIYIQFMCVCVRVCLYLFVYAEICIYTTRRRRVPFFPAFSLGWCWPGLKI